MPLKRKMELIDSLAQFYETECLEELESVEEKLAKEFKQILDKYCAQYSLAFSNSVHQIKYYSVVSRVKKPISFKEKMVRKSIGLQVITEYDLLDVTIPHKREEIRSYMLKYDDIVGIKIMTELNYDCISVYCLLKDHKTELIDIDFLDYDKQPKAMKNGLPIYNIKGLYNEKYGFELQIKSKIGSAWGDIDHGLFYKNYLYNPIKDTVQISMNHVGNLLNEIEDHLYSLREANTNYYANVKRLEFLEQISQLYSLWLKDLLGFAFKFDDVIDILLYLYEELYGETQIVDSDIRFFQLDFSYQTYIFEESEVNSFIQIINQSFNLTIIENIYFQWLFKENPINEEDCRTSVISLQKSLFSYIKSYLINEKDVDPEISESVVSILPQLMNYVGKDIFLNVNSYHQIVLYKLLLLDSEGDQGATDNWLLLFAVYVFEGNLQGCIKEVLNIDSIESMEEVKNRLLKVIDGIEKMNNAEVKDFTDITIFIFEQIVEGVGNE